MERREFFKIAAGVASGFAGFAVTAQAAPLNPQPLKEDAKPSERSAHPAVTSQEESDRLQPEEVQWGHHHHRRRHPHWRRRHWRHPHRRHPHWRPRWSRRR